MAKPFTSLSSSGDLVASYPTHFWHPIGGERAEQGFRIGTIGGAVNREQMNSMMAVAVVAAQPLFTVLQWQELKLQVLIYKYLAMGHALPDILVHHFCNSIETMVSRYYHHPSACALGYPPTVGNDLDLEPWRCRRTDGKKWRCSKEAYPDSKYCQSHMHRGSKRSKKRVEEPPQAESPCASTVTSLAWSGSSGGSFQGIPLNSLGGSSNAAGSFPGGTGLSQPSICPGSYGIAGKEFRYPYGLKGDLDEHSLFSEAFGNAGVLGIDSSLDNSWSPMPSQMSLFPPFEARNNSALQSSNLQLPALQDPWQASISSLSKLEQQQDSFVAREFGSAELAMHESQSLQPFDTWSDLEEEWASQNSFSTTQLPISMPMTSSSFTATNS